MNKIIGIVLSIVLVAFIGGYFMLFSKVPYEVITSLPVDSRVEDIKRDRDNPVTIAIEEEYISILPPYGYEIEFIDVVRDGGITMLYNLRELEDPKGEAPAFTVKVSNPLKEPIGATCQNFDILYHNQNAK